jgi:hypothetical protein
MTEGDKGQGADAEANGKGSLVWGEESKANR